MKAKLRKIVVMEMQFEEDEMGDLLQALQRVSMGDYPKDQDSQIASQILEVHGDACSAYDRTES